MAKKDKYLVGLDIGSTKTSILIAEIEGEFVKFLALGAAESKGLRKGLIVNLDATVSSIRRAVEEAEGVANVPVEEALIGVAGNHVRGANSRGGIALGPRPRDIEREDVRRAVDAARNISLPEDREVLHVLPHEFIVDAQDSIRDPVGMVGQRLVANVYVVTSSIAASQNLVTAANKAGILISDTVLEPLASAEACLTQDERDLACCLLDIGGGTTEIIAYGGGVELFVTSAWFPSAATISPTILPSACARPLPRPSASSAATAGPLLLSSRITARLKSPALATARLARSSRTC